MVLLLALLPAQSSPRGLQGGADLPAVDVPVATVVVEETPDPGLLLPDLITEAPDELYVQVDPRTSRREIRFSTTVTNRGLGPMRWLGLWTRRARQ